MIELPDWWAETWSAGRLAAWTPRVLLDDPDQVVVQGDRACSTCTTRSGADRPSSPPTAHPARMPTGLCLRELVRRRTGGPPRDAVLSPGEVILLLSWLDYSAADAFRTTVTLHGNARLRQVRVVRDYGMYDRRGEPPVLPRGRPTLSTRVNVARCEADRLVMTI